MILTIFSLVVPWVTYDTSDIDMVYEDAYLAQETDFSIITCLDIITNNVYLNIEAYVLSVFLGYGAIIDTIVNIGQTGTISAATEYITGDPFLFIKFTLVHGTLEDISTILNTFASMILVYFIIVFTKDAIKPRKIVKRGVLTNSWELNQIHLKQSLIVFVIGILIMINAGILEEYISVPIGDFIVSII